MEIAMVIIAIAALLVSLPISVLLAVKAYQALQPEITFAGEGGFEAYLDRGPTRTYRVYGLKKPKDYLGSDDEFFQEHRAIGEGVRWTGKRYRIYIKKPNKS